MLFVLLTVTAIFFAVWLLIVRSDPVLEAKQQQVISDVEEAADEAVVLVEDTAKAVVAKVKRTRKKKTEA